MSQNKICKLCGQTNETFGHTINDKIITQFLLNAVVRLNNADKNINVCNLCYAKAKIVVDFVKLVNSTQNNQPQSSGGSSLKIASIHNGQNQATNILNSFDDPNAIYGVFNDDSNFYEDENNSEPNQPPSKKISPQVKSTDNRVRKSKRAEPQKNAFKCGNCKKEHKNFAELEGHIVNCFKASIEIKCFICEKEFETRKKLHSHMETHKVYKRRRRTPAKKPQNAKSKKIKCNQRTASSNTLSDLTKHKEGCQDPEDPLEKKIKCEEVDMNEVLLENARRIIQEIS